MTTIPLRWRLTAAFTLATALVLAIVGLFLHARLRAELDGTLRTGLRQRAGDLVIVARGRPAMLGRGQLVEPGDDLAQILDLRGRVVEGAPGFGRDPLLLAAEVVRAAKAPLLVDERRVGEEDSPPPCSPPRRATGSSWSAHRLKTVTTPWPSSTGCCSSGFPPAWRSPPSRASSSPASRCARSS